MNDNEVVLLGDDRPNVASVAGKADEAAGNGCEDGNDTEGGVTPAPAQAVELAVDEKGASDTERGTRERESAEVIEERLLGDGVFDDNFLSLKEDAGEELLAEILTLYISDGEETVGSLAKLCEPADGCDLEEVQKLVHRFKGSSLNVGVAQICECCMDIRRLCVEEKKEEVRDKIASLGQTFGRTKADLEAYLESISRRKRKKAT